MYVYKTNTNRTIINRSACDAHLKCDKNVISCSQNFAFVAYTSIQVEKKYSKIKMSTNKNLDFVMENQIQIMQVETPHKFWFKYNDKYEMQLLKKLEENIDQYVADLIKWKEQMIPISYGDVVAAFHPNWQKWIRGKVGKIQKGISNLIHVWAIDYGCKLLLPLDKVYLLKHPDLACRHPINVHIGGLSDISPAFMVNYYFFDFFKFILHLNCYYLCEFDNFEQIFV